MNKLRKIRKIRRNYAYITQKLRMLRRNYAEIMQKVRKNYGKITQKNYAKITRVCVICVISKITHIEVVESERCCAERCAGVSYGSIKLWANLFLLRHLAGQDYKRTCYAGLHPVSYTHLTLPTILRV